MNWYLSKLHALERFRFAQLIAFGLCSRLSLKLITKWQQLTLIVLGQAVNVLFVRGYWSLKGDECTFKFKAITHILVICLIPRMFCSVKTIFRSLHVYCMVFFLLFRGFKVIVKRDHDYFFKPISVQALWATLQALHLAIKVARDNNYYAKGLSHTWITYYISNINSTRLQINEWRRTEESDEESRGFATASLPQEWDFFFPLLRTCHRDNVNWTSQQTFLSNLKNES